jgi:hypothetical protein
LADEVTQHQAERGRARAELTLHLNLLKQAGQLGVEDQAAGSGRRHRRYGR